MANEKERTEGILRIGGPSYEAIKQIEKYLEKEFGGEIPSDTYFYSLAEFNEEESTFYTNAEYIIASNKFKGFLFAYESAQLVGALNYYVEDRNASITDADIVPGLRETELFTTLHKLFRDIVTDMDSYKINLVPNKENFLYKSNPFDNEEEQIEINKKIAEKLGYKVIGEEAEDKR